MNNSVPLTEVGTQVTIEKAPARAPVFKSLVNTTSWRLSVISFTYVRVARPSLRIGWLDSLFETKEVLDPASGPMFASPACPLPPSTEP